MRRKGASESGMSFWVKVHGTVLAACDEGLPGRVLHSDGLELEVKPSFYQGTLVEEAEFLSLLEKMGNINLVGENTVGLASKKGHVKSVLKIQDVPYALIFKE